MIGQTNKQKDRQTDKRSLETSWFVVLIKYKIACFKILKNLKILNFKMTTTKLPDDLRKNFVHYFGLTAFCTL